jgi:TRAP-type C4-dicarboxylate transport system substrate-binding protein
MTVLNEDWFQMQTDEVKAAIIEAGRAAEQQVFPWGVENVAKTYKVWTDNGGIVHELSDEDQAKMEQDFAKVSADVLAGEPAVQAEYERLRGLVDAKRAQ